MIKESPDRAVWADALHEAGIDAEKVELIQASPLDWGRRVYRQGDLIHKIVLRSYSTTIKERNRDLREEFEILESLRGLQGVPEARGCTSVADVDVLTMRAVEGVPWHQYRGKWERLLRCLPRFIGLLVRLSMRRVVHGDVKPANVLVDADGCPWLVDFDQAQVSTRVKSLGANLFGVWLGSQAVHSGGWQFVRELIVAALPKSLREALRWVKRRISKGAAHRVPRLEKLPDNPSEQLQLMHKAWSVAADSDANAPGLGVCYYSTVFQGFHLPGERPWEDRWNSLKHVVSWRGARVLELGCNVGLLSAFALMSGAEATLGVDRDALILEANQLVQRAYGVSYKAIACNFDAPSNWEADLAAFRPTLVTALSVLNWLDDKNRFVRFLGRFNLVLFEGHDSDVVEADRLRAVGFTSVQLVTRSERQRAVLLARKA